MARLTNVPEACGEIARADEDAIDALDSSNRLYLLQRFTRLDLHEQAELFSYPPRVAIDAPEAGGARYSGHSPHSFRRVADRGNGTSSFFRVLDVRDQQRLHAKIEEALDQYGVVTRRAHDGSYVISRNRLQLTQNRQHVAR